MKKFTTLSVNVTEEIKPNRFRKFIQTQIELNQILISHKSCFYSQFIPELLRYEIIIFKDISTALNSDLFTLSNLCNEYKYTLFIFENLFCMYHKQSLLFIKETSNNTQEDIKSYIEQTYMIKPCKSIYIDTNKIQNLKNHYNNKTKKNTLKQLHKVILTNSFQYFVYYLLILTLIFGFLIYDNFFTKELTTINPTRNKNHITKLNLYKNHSHNNNFNKLFKFIDFLTKEQIDILTVNYTNSKIFLELTNNNKEKLMKLLEYSSIKPKLVSIYYDKTIKGFIMGIILYA